jgi:hypothetical protein
MYITRHQVPISPAFALTEYKVQSSTYGNAVLDLRRQFKPREAEAFHKEYCTINVQLSRLRTRKGVHLLQPISLSDLDIRMHPLLYKEDRRLQQLAAVTMQLEMDSPIGDL